MSICLRGRLLAGAVLSLLSITAAVAAGSGGMGTSDSPSQSAPRYDAAEQYAKGLTALRAEDYKAARTAMGRVVGALPNNAEAWRMLGAANAGLKDFKGARRAYEHAVKLEPDQIDSHLGLGLALAGLKDAAKAGDELAWLKARSAAYADACAEAAALKAAVAQLETAIAGGAAALAPESMLFSGPAGGDRAYMTAVALINARRYDEALASLAQARQAFGPHPDILTYQGYAWRRKGDYARAETYYRQALALAPTHRGPRNTMANSRSNAATWPARARCSPDWSGPASTGAPRPRSCAVGSTPATSREARRRPRPGRRRGPGADGRCAAARPALAFPQRRRRPRPEPHADRVPEAAPPLPGAGRGNRSRGLSHTRAAGRPGRACGAELRVLSSRRAEQSRLPVPRAFRGARHGRRHLLADERPPGRRHRQSPPHPRPERPQGTAQGLPGPRRSGAGALRSRTDRGGVRRARAPASVLAGLAAYIRALDPAACPAGATQPLTPALLLDDALRAAAAAQTLVGAHDAAGALVMVAAARARLGLIDERYPGPRFAALRERLRRADGELAGAAEALRRSDPAVAGRLARWRAEAPFLGAELARQAPASLFDSGRLAATLQRRLPR